MSGAKSAFKGAGYANDAFDLTGKALNLIGMIPGVEIPSGLLEAFGVFNGDPSLDLLNEMNGKLDDIYQQGLKILSDIDMVKDELHNIALNSIKTSAVDAQQYLNDYKLNGTDFYRNSAIEKSRDALTAAEIFAGNEKADISLIIPSLLTAFTTRVNVIRETSDGATSGEAKVELSNAIAVLETSVAKYEAQLSDTIHLRVDFSYDDMRQEAFLVAWIDTGNGRPANAQAAAFITDFRNNSFDVEATLKLPPYKEDLYNPYLAIYENCEVIDNEAMRSVFRDYRYKDYTIPSLSETEANYLEKVIYPQAHLSELKATVDTLKQLVSGQWVIDVDGTVDHTIQANHEISETFDQWPGFTAPHTLEGRAGNDTVIGGEGNDTLRGGGGDPARYGTYGDGNDRLHGKGGDDILVGGTGNDWLDGGSGDDRIDGGAGIDTASYVSATDAVSVSLDLKDWQDTGFGKDRLISIENLEGSNFYDTLVGSVENNTISGLGGSDVIDGRQGADRMIGGTGSDYYYVDNVGDTVVELAGEGIDAVQSSLLNYTLGANVEQLIYFGSDNFTGIGNELNNYITGFDGADKLDGKAGADTMAGYRGNDTYLIDNAGDEVLEYINEGVDRVISSVSYTLADNVEYLTLTTSTALNGTGNALANTIVGNAGANVLDGKFGLDTLSGGAGADTFAFSTRLGSDNVDHIIDFLAADDTIKLDAGHFAELAGGALATSAFKNLSTGTLDADDRVLYDASTGSLSYDVDGSGIKAAVQFAILDNKAVITAADFVVTGTGTGGGTGGTGGGTGLNVVAGATAGNDTLTGTAAGDLIEGLGGADKLSGLAGADTLYGGAGADALDGGVDNDTLYGGADDDKLNGGAGADLMFGGAGNDTYEVYAAGDIVREDTSAGVDDGGLDSVNSGISYTLTSFVEKLTLTGTTALDGTGNGSANTLIGNGAANVLDGKAGADILTGSTGADTFAFSRALGSANVDRITDFVVVDDTIRLDANVFTALTAGALSADAFKETSAGGAVDTSDRILYNKATGALSYDADGSGTASAAVQFATLDNKAVLTAADFTVVGTGTPSGGGLNVVGGGTEGADTLTGTAAGDLIEGLGGADKLSGLAGADTLYGGAGADALDGGVDNDTLYGGADDDKLNGGAGADLMFGGAGNDTYEVYAAGDIVREDTSAGVDDGGLDSVNSGISYTLTSFVEKLTLTGTTALDGTGNGSANTLIGNGAANVLDGKAGADILTGGTGADTFAFSTALGSANVDRITDFVAVDDTIRLDANVFTAMTAGALAADAFKETSAGGAVDTSDRILYNKATGALSYDADGSGTSSAAIQFAMLDNKAVLTAADFFV